MRLSTLLSRAFGRLTAAPTRPAKSALLPALLLVAALPLGAFAQTTSRGALPASGSGAGGGQGALGSGISQVPGAGHVPPIAPQFLPWYAEEEELDRYMHPGSPLVGWTQAVEGVFVKLLPPVSADPLLEVLLMPPHSGHPTKPERFVLQVPVGPNVPPVRERGLVIGFHPYGVSEKSVLNTQLPHLCAARGWLLLAPFGLVNTNFANLESQQSLDAVLALLAQYGYPFNRDLVYTVGFSMGGLNAISYAMRHQDPGGLVRIAGVVNHTGTMDVIDQYLVGPPVIQQLMSGPDHFQGTPSQNPFNWSRINPLRLIGGAVQPSSAHVANLRGLPIYLHWNTQDPNLNLVQYSQALQSYLSSVGANVFTRSGPMGFNVHAWSTLDLVEALDFVTQAAAPKPGDLLGGYQEIFADRTAVYRYTEVLEIDPQQVARYRLQQGAAGSNLTAVQGARHVRRLALDMVAAGIDPSLPASVISWTTDGQPLTLVLRGYASPPSAVTLGGVPLAGWVHDSAAGELTLTPNGTGAYAQVQILP